MSRMLGLIILLGFVSMSLFAQGAPVNNSQKGLWSKYYLKTINKGPNVVVTQAVKTLTQKNKGNITVLDLGAGAGNNIQNLLKDKATVYAFDVDSESIFLLKEKYSRYVNNKKLILKQVNFNKITALPRTNLTIAWRSFAFMEKKKFPFFWKMITDALETDGIFTGTFFGDKHYLKCCKKRRKIFRLTKPEVLNLFKGYQILYFKEVLELDERSLKAWGSKQQEHIFRVIARKK